MAQVDRERVLHTKVASIVVSVGENCAHGEVRVSTQTSGGEAAIIIEVAMGAVATVLLLILVGVVTEWVWSCCMNRSP